MLHRSLAATLLCFFAGGVAIAETPADLMARVAKRSGESVIRTAEISFDAAIAKAPPSKEKIAEAIERQRKAILYGMEHYRDNPWMKKALEDSLPNNEKETTEQVIANANVIISGIYMIGGPSMGGDRFVEFRVRHGYDDPKSQPQAMALLIRHLPGSRQTSLVLDGQARTAVASGNGAMVGIGDPHVLGRLQGSVLYSFGGDIGSAGSAAKAIEKPTLSYSFNREDAARMPGLTCVDAFVLKGTDRRLFAKIAVDEKRDLICPLIEEYDETGAVRARWASEDYFQDKQSLVWFPAKCRQSWVLNGEPTTIDYKINPEASTFNRAYPASRFTCPLPVGTTLINDLGPKQESWIVKKGFSLSIDGLDRIGARPELEKPVVVRLPAEESARTSSSRGILIALNVLALGVGAIIYFRRKRRKLALCLLACAGPMGGLACTRSETGSIPAASGPGLAGPLRSTPSPVDLGTIAAETSPLDSSARLTNDDKVNALNVHMTSGCGCTTLSNPEFAIPPGGTVTVPFPISPEGRNGPFETSLIARWSSKTGGKPEGMIAIPVKVTFLRTIFAMPSRIFVDPSSKGDRSGSGVVSITAPHDQWPSLTIAADDKSLAVEELGSDPRSAGTETRRYRLKSATDAQPADSSLRVHRSGQVEPVLTIPILAGSIPAPR